MSHEEVLREALRYGHHVSRNDALAALDALVVERDEARQERDLAIAHDLQPYPTAWAYEQLVKAHEKAEADLAAAREERDALKRTVEGIRETNDALQRSAIGNRDGRWAAEAQVEEALASLKTTRSELDTLRQALEEIVDDRASLYRTRALEIARAALAVVADVPPPAECHICHKRRDEPGELYCSAPHPVAEAPAEEEK